MKSTHKITIVLGLLIIASSLWGQGNMMMRNPRIRKMIEQERIPYFTKELNLTPEEAKQFWPLYDEYQEKLHALMKKDRTLGNSIMSDESTLSDNQKIYQEVIAIIDQKAALKKEYLEKFKTVLPLQKVNKLMYIEHGFRMYLIRKNMGKKMHDDADE
jgi:Spy/CpxP family protein refolding chaperone